MFLYQLFWKVFEKRWIGLQWKKRSENQSFKENRSAKQNGKREENFYEKKKCNVLEYLKTKNRSVEKIKQLNFIFILFCICPHASFQCRCASHWSEICLLSYSCMLTMNASYHLSYNNCYSYCYYICYSLCGIENSRLHIHCRRQKEHESSEKQIGWDTSFGVLVKNARGELVDAWEHRRTLISQASQDTMNSWTAQGGRWRRLTLDSRFSCTDRERATMAYCWNPLNPIVSGMV